jgi:hypothetical protein
LVSIDTVRQQVRPRTRAASLGAAILAHLALAAGLVLAIQAPKLFEPPVVQVSLVPPIPTEIAPARPRRTALPPPPQNTPPIAPRQGKLVGPAQIPPLPIPAAPPDTATRDRLFSAPFKPHDALRDSLRAGTGCQNTDKLTPDERSACRKHEHDLGANAPTYDVGPSDPEKRAYLDKQAAKNEAHRKAMEAPGQHPMEACTGPMSNLGFSCNSGSTAHLSF